MKNTVRNRHILYIFLALLIVLSSLVSSAKAYTFQDGIVVLDREDMSKTDYIIVDHYTIKEIKNQTLEIDKDITYYYNLNDSVTVVIPIINETFSFYHEVYEVKAGGTKGEMDAYIEHNDKGQYQVNLVVNNYTIPPLSMVYSEVDSAIRAEHSTFQNSLVFEGQISTASSVWANFMQTTVLIPKNSGWFDTLTIVDVTPIPDSRYDTRDFAEITWKSDRNRNLKTHYIQPYSIRYYYSINPNISLGFLVFFSTLFAYLLADVFFEGLELRNKIASSIHGKKLYLLAFGLMILFLIIIAVIGSTI